MIRVLVVDDSSTARLVLSRELDAQPDFTVVGTAAGAVDAQRLVQVLHPDDITLDLQMPGMSGLELLGWLMAEHPLPVVIVSSLAAARGNVVLEALRLGAVDVVGKARLGADRAAAAPLIDAVRAASLARLPRAPAKQPARSDGRLRPAGRRRGCEVIAIGASTGGTRAIDDILRRLPPDVPGIVIAQHLPESFAPSFAQRLNAVSDLTVSVARTGDEVARGTALVIPGGSNAGLVRAGRALRLVVSPRAPRVGGHSPSADELFESVAQVCGRAAVGILLTGMGTDGARGLASMRAAGAFTIAEHESSCVVYGMPRAAVTLGAACAVTALSDMPAQLLALLGRSAPARI
jgi:two-component system chemotaxis response regulator CheB